MQFTSRQAELGELVLDKLTHFFSDNDLSDCALSYSGGLDSTILLALSPKSVRPYTLGDSGSRDYANSILGSDALDFKVTHFDLSRLDIDKYLSIIKEIDPDISRADIGYELVLAVILDLVPESRIMTGQGADELFYGYHRFIEDPEMSNEWHLRKLENETLRREKAIADHFGKQLVTPYLDAGLVGILSEVSRDDHFAEGYNKAILRYTGIKIGLPESVYTVRKTAAQYGSGMMKKLRTTSQWNP